ncbi:hypothetical protein JAAARDRAFT_561401 [Jaapia argillacea MUCL 33604]|uniref:Uncharacterized protein n=1 Tax=Jaapia argillacea MUCL 33604 TaxID=933084 RepID=A0A067QB81_9AGAM|nr:hypothetical protein JAAARDRAFT_561401 [Jaapia argillacea MUCL 33604]
MPYQSVEALNDQVESATISKNGNCCSPPTFSSILSAFTLGHSSLSMSIDPSAPLTVAKGAATTSVVTSTLAASYGLLKPKGPPPVALALSAGINGGIAGATFFSIREYLITPLFLSIQDGLTSSPQLGERLTWRDMRMDRVVDTGLSGAITGGLLNSIKRGRGGVMAGFTTGALLCTLLQFGWNEVGVMRLKYISRNLPTSAASLPRHQISSSEFLPSTSSNTPDSTSNRDISYPNDDLSSPVTIPERERSWAERMLDALHFKKVSDQEYADILKRKRDGFLVQIAELEKQVEDENRKKNEEGTI